ncbi:MAG: stage II sporulation protein P [Lachnospiraceae bacterium]|jgi:stage II sporulation protein P|nr:stage II sporulation protein P [Lachnospiraceae bacterium]
MQWCLGGASVLFVFVCYQNMSSLGKAPAMEQIGNFIREEIAVQAWKNCMPAMLREGQEAPVSMEEYLLGKLESVFPVYGFSDTIPEYDTQIESDLSCGLLAENAKKAGEGQESGEGEEGEKEEREGAEGKAAGDEDGAAEKEGKEGQGKEGEDKEEEGQKKEKKKQDGQSTHTKTAKAVEIPREKLDDFDYLLQNFYQVDRTTTIDSSQLNAAEMLAKDMKLQGGDENVQILIYHTHSQEGYADSVPGDPSTSVVGVGEKLATLLREEYGFHVMHHTGEYDVADRDNAYSYAGPALEQILAENPSIEVVIDLHRDGVAETTHLVSEVNGKQTSQIMFFNGLSRTTANGDIAYLANPNLADNLAFSFQMKLAAEEYYPGFARGTYLKGYRYNLHYRPKSLLVEVGAQTNTVEEAMNAMEPLADLLHKVLGT